MPVAEHGVVAPEPLARRLAEMSAATGHDDVPTDVLDRHRLAVLDLLGALVAGAGTATARSVAEATIALTGDGRATTASGHTGVSTLAAAATNAAAAHALELDDVHADVTGWHPAASMVPALMAVGQVEDLHGRDVLDGIVAGYEVGGRIGAAMTPHHRRRGFHATGTVGALATAAAVARARRLDASDTASALGLASSMAGGTFGVLAGAVEAKHLHAAHAAVAGIWAVQLVVAGLPGPHGALEAPEGFFTAYAGGEWDAARACRARGHPWEIERQMVKPHACCAHVFGAIDAAVALRDRLPAPADRAEAIEVDTYDAAAVLDDSAPVSATAAKFSLPFCVALTLVDGLPHDHLSPADFDAAWERPDVRELARRVAVRRDDESDAAFPAQRTTTVRVRTADGEVVTHRVDQPRGMPRNPVSSEQLRAKFTGLARPVLGEGAAHVARLVDDISHTPHWSSEISAALTP